MLEGAFDTVTALIFVVVIGRCIFARQVIDRLLGQFDNPLLVWILFWGLSMVPFLIRLKTLPSTETNEGGDTSRQ